MASYHATLSMPSVPTTPIVNGVNLPSTSDATAKVNAADLDTERDFQEIMMQLGFQMPMAPLPKCHSSYKELLQTILEHMNNCPLKECSPDIRESENAHY